MWLMETQEARQPEQKGERGRRPYERPVVLWEEDFLPYVYSACGKMPGGGAGCNANKKS